MFMYGEVVLDCVYFSQQTQNVDVSLQKELQTHRNNFREASLLNINLTQFLLVTGTCVLIIYLPTLNRLPPEIILKILSYLDAGSLLCLSFVNKHFNELTNSK